MYTPCTCFSFLCSLTSSISVNLSPQWHWFPGKVMLSEYVLVSGSTKPGTLSLGDWITDDPDASLAVDLGFFLGCSDAWTFTLFIGMMIPELASTCLNFRCISFKLSYMSLMKSLSSPSGRSSLTELTSWRAPCIQDSIFVRDWCKSLCFK